ncbi:hypothetical protein MKX01_007108 [Papaver californicum]|nr:hypothetical protein MKX01_007108 [Papaver californicum]
MISPLTRPNQNRALQSGLDIPSNASNYMIYSISFCVGNGEICWQVFLFVFLSHFRMKYYLDMILILVVLNFQLFSISDSDSENDDLAYAGSEAQCSANSIEIIEDVIASLSTLTVDQDNHSKDQMVSNSASWRSNFSKVDIWYASFGSNMWKPRFLC